MTNRCLMACCFAVLAAMMSSFPLFAQVDTATLSGRITDPQGSAVPKARVQIVNIDTNVSMSTETNNEGIYVFTGIKPARYRLLVVKDGFHEVVKPEFTLQVQDHVEQNFGLQIGSVNETVTVTGGAPLVNTESAAVSTVIDRNFAESLPLNGRSFNTLLQLTPGVVIPPSNINSPGQFSVAGQRTDANNFLVDGVSANFGVSGAASVSGGAGQAQAFSALGGTSSLVSVDALQEFRVETSSFAPEFGKTPGGQVILTTRSGTNDFHGGLFEYLRNDVMDANDWFNNAATPSIPRAPERHNDFGGFLGGRILKDNTFFFLSYEGARLRQPQSRVTNVPSLAARSSARPQVAPFLNAFPLPNGPVSPNGTTAQFTGSFSNPATLDAGSVRLDHTFSSRFSIFGRYNNAPSQTITRGSDLSQLNATSINTQTLTVGSTMQFSARLSDSLRGNYSTQDSSIVVSADSLGGAVPLDSGLLLGSLPASKNLGSFLLIGAGLYTAGPSARNKASQLNVADDLAITLGTHQLKLGGDYRAIYLDNNPFEHQLFYFATIPGLLSPTPRAVTLSAATIARSQFLFPSLSLYGQDTWKIGSRLTLTYGLRWELNPAPRARGGTVLASWTNVNDPTATVLAPPGTAVWKTTYDNFAPRIGMAYSVTEKGDFVIKTGFGIFYDLGVGESGALGSTFPNSRRQSFRQVSLPIADPTPFLPVLSSQPPYTGTIFAFSPNLTLPRSYQWNLALEKSLGNKQAISATYVGQTGKNLLRQAASNPSNSNFAPGSVFNLTDNSASSNYHALQMQYRRPLADRLQILLNYTWSHSIDDVSDDTVQFISGTVFSNQNNRGSSDFDVRHSLSAALTYVPPGLAKSGVLAILTRDWSIDSIVVVRSGFPFNAVVGSVPSPVQGTNVRPDRVPGQPLWVSAPNAPGGKMLNSTMDPNTGAITGGAFAIPPVDPVTGAFLRQGTEGRNDIRGFGLTQVDLSISRKFPLPEKFNLQFRADAFNVFNHPNFTNPSGAFDFGATGLRSTLMLNQGLQGLNPLFQEGGPRSLQLSLRLTF